MSTTNNNEQIINVVGQAVLGPYFNKIFETEYTLEKNFTQISIQAPPASVVIFNGNINDRIYIGQTGIYEIQLPKGAYITKITIPTSTLSYINGSAGHYMIIDYIEEISATGGQG